MSTRQVQSDVGVSAGAGTGVLVKDASSALAALVRAEIALAKDELAGDLREAKAAGIVGVAAAACAVVGAGLLLGAMIAAGRRHPSVLAALGCGLLGASVALGREALRDAPALLARTRRRAMEDVSGLEEGLRADRVR
jgi:hypothetical protein